MGPRIYILFILSLCGSTALHAQWNHEDSLKLQKFLSGKEEIKLNENAVKSIRFGMPTDQKEINLQPVISETKPYMDFLEELPEIFTDSLAYYHRKIFLRPYNVFTRYDEDPIYGKNKYVNRMQYNFNKPFDIRERFVTPGRFYDPGKMGFGVSFAFSMEDALQYIFSKKGRARMRNAKNANAWKTYNQPQ